MALLLLLLGDASSSAPWSSSIHWADARAVVLLCCATPVTSQRLHDPRLQSGSYHLHVTKHCLAHCRKQEQLTVHMQTTYTSCIHMQTHMQTTYTSWVSCMWPPVMKVWVCCCLGRLHCFFTTLMLLMAELERPGMTGAGCR